MASIQRTIQCPLPGLEAVAVTYNLMASADQIETFTESLGGEERPACIVSVEGWPEKEFGTDPFGGKSPLAFRVWAVQRGLQQAVKEFVTDPN